MIAAYPPEARGCSERIFRILQDRLPKELALAGIIAIAAANTFLATYWSQFNATFAPKNLGWTIPAHKHRYHFAKVQARVHEYSDRTLAIFHGSRCLSRYTATGELLDDVAGAKKKRAA